MASATVENADGSILNPEYMALLQRLCVNSKPSVNDVTTIFREFRRSLDARILKTSHTQSAESQISSGASKKRRGKAVTRGGTLSDEADSSATVLEVVRFERSCTWEPDQKLCWIVSDLELWNRILAQNCVELREHTWGELSVRGYQWPESRPTAKEALRASLLIHLLLRQHRCVTSIYLDMHVTTIETYVLWDAIKTGAGGVKVLESKPRFLNKIGLSYSTETTLFCEAIATMKNLTLLRLSSMHFDNNIASKLGGYVEQATALTTLILLHTTAEDTDASVFLDHLARNRSVKRLTVPQALLTARQGHALADVVRDHLTLEELEVNGAPKYSPSVLLRAAVQSCSLQRLTVCDCAVKAEDIEAMASALTQSPKFDAATPPPPPPQLQRLSFFNCARGGFRLERAYANLIGGVLVRLRLYACGLSDVFATATASKLRSDRRLRKLQLEINSFTITGIHNIIRALKRNTSLQVLVLNMTDEHKEEDVASLFDVIRAANAFSRLRFHWVHPRPSDLSNSLLATKTISVCLSLDNRGAEYAGECLGIVSMNHKLHMLLLECTAPLGQAVVQKLVDTCASTRSLRHLMLNLKLHDADVVKLFRALESNRTISVLDLRSITFWKRTAKALGQLVERNHKLVFVTVTVDDKDADVDCTVQIRYICRELKEALVGNRFMMGVAAVIQRSKLHNLPDIKNVLGRNAMLINRAIRFVMGSMEKEDALAFDILQHSESLNIKLKRKWKIPRKRALVMISEAREKLSFNYFALAGVVKAKVVCHRDIKGKKKKQRKHTLLDDMSRDLQARICSYLSLTDVVDI